LIPGCSSPLEDRCSKSLSVMSFLLISLVRTGLLPFVSSPLIFLFLRDTMPSPGFPPFSQFSVWQTKGFLFFDTFVIRVCSVTPSWFFPYRAFHQNKQSYCATRSSPVEESLSAVTPLPPFFLPRGFSFRTQMVVKTFFFSFTFDDFFFKTGRCAPSVPVLSRVFPFRTRSLLAA